MRTAWNTPGKSMAATWLVVVISRISVRPWPRSKVTWCTGAEATSKRCSTGGDASLGGEARGELAFQRRLVARHASARTPRPDSASAVMTYVSTLSRM
jgi:hypothetical protein